jgi:hypothetical protein
LRCRPIACSRIKRRLANFAASFYSESRTAIRTRQKIRCPLPKMACHLNAAPVAHQAIGIELARRRSCVRSGFGAAAYMQIAASGRVRFTDYSGVMRHIELAGNGV